MNQKDQKKIIFLSHVTEDRDIAEILQSAIENAFPGAFDIFNAFQKNSIAPSEEWRTKLRNAVIDSSLLVVIITRNSLGRQWIFWESGGAYHRGIPIVPLLGPGCEKKNLPDTLREIQAISLQDEGGLRCFMDRIAKLTGMSRLSVSYDLSSVEKQIKNLQTPFEGKQWSKMTENALRRFLLNTSGETPLDIRAISYTSETISKAIPEFINQFQSLNAPLRIKIAVRSEYDRFASRPNDLKFNQAIRWRISRAKADWYRWYRNLRTQNASMPSISLEIRDYWWDPGPRALLLGRSEGFFGLYAMKFQTISTPRRPEIPPARDWVAADTSMAHINGTNQQLLDNLITWFDHIWEQSTKRTNEAYRCESSDTILELLDKKSETESQAHKISVRWRTPSGGTRQGWEIGNLALPASYPEETSEIIDFMACAMVFEETDDTVVLAEIRKAGETWEGIGKSSTYLDFVGIKPEISSEDQKIRSHSLSLLELYELICDKAKIKIYWNDKQRDPNLSIFTTDFVWAYQRDGVLRIIQPEGEVLWGLWDSARYLLRTSLSEEAWFDGVQRSELGRLIQKELFVQLPIGNLAKCYCKKVEVTPSAVVILCPSKDKEIKVEEVRNPEAQRQLLIEAIQSAPHHPSEFWRREDSEVQRHNDLAQRIVRKLRTELIPKIYTISGKVPLGSVSSIIKDEVYRGLRKK